MSVDTPAQAGVSIDALLAAKEQRAARQADWLAHYQQPVISLTLVTPGAVKDSIRYRNMMGVGPPGPAISCCGSTAGKRWIVRCYGCRPGQKRCGA
ncbi:phosphoribosyl-dephospho-CoA transferase [Klebsiella pneumoniae]|uniref:Apo-citrate lyase phosphoribosyl-dephospho-CoA transferase n=1 Tax=Klebsiella pneumoniae TaxID=573 RepID=A0A4P0XRD8_KLEPN|nr:phosphoribosyl-dephospho-CoA transferase [Klebsiella pneumoniae]